MFIRRLDLIADNDFYTNVYGGKNTAAQEYFTLAENMLAAAYGECSSSENGAVYYKMAVCAQAEKLAEGSGASEYKKLSLGDFSAEYADNTGRQMICDEAKLYIDKWSGFCHSVDVIY